MTYNHLERLLRNQSSILDRLNSRVLSTVFFGSFRASTPLESSSTAEWNFSDISATDLDDESSADSLDSSAELLPQTNPIATLSVQPRLLAEPLELTFAHLTATDGQSGSVRCVHWADGLPSDRKSSSPPTVSFSGAHWSQHGCHLMRTNRTHSSCRCRLPGHFALQMQDPNQPAAESSAFFPINDNLSSSSLPSRSASSVSSSSSAPSSTFSQPTSGSQSFNLFSTGTSTDQSSEFTRQLRHLVLAGSTMAAVFLLYTLAVLVTVTGDNSELLTICRHLCFCMLTVQMLLALNGVHQAGRPLLCSLVFSALHLFLLSALLWNFLLTFDLYLSALDVQEPVKNARRPFCYYALAYAGSCLVLLVTLAMDAGPLTSAGIAAGFTRATGISTATAAVSQHQHCWIDLHSYVCFTFVGPAGGVLLCSFLFLAIVRYVLSGGSCGSNGGAGGSGSLLMNGHCTPPIDYGKCPPSSVRESSQTSPASAGAAVPVVGLGSSLKPGYAPTTTTGTGALTITTTTNTTSATACASTATTLAYGLQRRPVGHELHCAVRMTLLLLLLQCMCWAAGAVHVAQPQSFGWALLFAFAQPLLALHVLIYVSVRISSMEHHRFAPHLRLGRYIRDHCCRIQFACLSNGSQLVNGGVAPSMSGYTLNGAGNRTMAATLTGGSNSLTNTGSSCLSNSKSGQPLYGSHPADVRNSTAGTGSLYGSNYGFGSMTPVYQQPVYQPVYQQVGNTSNNISHNNNTQQQPFSTLMQCRKGVVATAQSMNGNVATNSRLLRQSFNCSANHSGCTPTSMSNSSSSACACPSFVNRLPVGLTNGLPNSLSNGLMHGFSTAVAVAQHNGLNSINGLVNSGTHRSPPNISVAGRLQTGSATGT